MRKIASLCLAFAFCAVLGKAKSPPKSADFSGNWVLDASQTKKVPTGLESYTMRVAQDTQRVKVQTTLKGDLRPVGDLNGPYPQGGPGTGYPGSYPGRMGRMGGMGMPGGGMGGGPMSEGMPTGAGMPGGSGGGPRMGRQSSGTAAAFSLYPETAVYRLDGSESSVELGGPMHTDATSKAAWAKSNKELKLSLTGASSSSWRGGSIDVKDQWKLSKDGQHLLVDRTVHSPSGSTSIHLVFDRQPAGSA
jgi:hypothetical protein